MQLVRTEAGLVGAEARFPDSGAEGEGRDVAAVGLALEHKDLIVVTTHRPIDPTTYSTEVDGGAGGIDHAEAGDAVFLL